MSCPGNSEKSVVRDWGPGKNIAKSDCPPSRENYRFARQPLPDTIRWARGEQITRMGMVRAYTGFMFAEQGAGPKFLIGLDAARTFFGWESYSKRW